jgi:hypothetical protein
VAVIDWKGAKWRAAHSSLSIPDLLTVLKGFGPMEVLRFEKPDCCSGEMSLCLTDDGSKEITLYHLEVDGPKRQGGGRAALKWLREIFKGAIFPEFPDMMQSRPYHPSLPFWLRMYREGLVDGLDCENFYLSPGATALELDRLEREVRSALESKPAAGKT